MVITAQNIHQKPGYKQTEVGVIPEDWEVANLKRFWAVIDCKHLTAKFVEIGIPLASIREVQSRFVELENAKQTTNFYYLELIEGGRKPQPSDLIFSRNATVGEIAQVAEWHPPFAMGQDVCLLRKKQSDASSDYLQAVIRSSMVLKQLANFMVGSTFKRVNVEQIRNLIVPMPLPEEQTAIATILSDTDSLITSLDKLIAKKRDIKLATMQQLLTGKTRLPGFSGEWEVKKLGDVAAILKGNGLSKNKIAASGKLQCILYGELFTTYGRVISHVISSTNTIEGVSSNYGDILIPGSTTTVGIDLATASALLQANVLLGGDINIVRARGNWYHPVFLAYYLTESRKQAIAEYAQGITIIHLYGRDLLELEISLAPLEEQTAIATVLTDIDAEITALEQKRDKTCTLKQGMMQELLTGKTRLL